MLNNLSSRLVVTAAFALAATSALAAPFAVDTANPANGLSAIYSTTFQGALPACTGSSPSYCSFFGGDPASITFVGLSPDPSGVIAGTPVGIGPLGVPVAPTPLAGSFLDLTLSGGNTSLTLGGGSSIAFGTVVITIPTQAVATAVGAGMVIDVGGTTSVNGSGQAEFLVTAAPGVGVDFSRFSQVVTSSSCTGPACGAILGDFLNLDMVRYRLFVDFDPTFTSFTADFIGQTANNSLVYATLNSGSPATLIPVPAAVWLLGSALAALVGLRRRVVA